jgi:redox-sensitive bicupin YhaK (pirin superfamily)
VFSSFLRAEKAEHYDLEPGRGVYLYVLEGGPIKVNNIGVPAFGSAMLTQEPKIDIVSERDAELLLVDVKT